MIIRSNESETFIFENDSIVSADIARAIIHADIQIMHREIGALIQNGIQNMNWGGDDQFFDSSPALINAYHAMLMAIHNEENMVGQTTIDDIGKHDDIDYHKVMLSLFDDDAFMNDITCMLADTIITIQSFMYDAEFMDDDDKDEASIKRTQFIANYYAKGD